MIEDYSRLFRLDGRRALVVGAGSGIGREAALALAAHGADVVCADRDASAAKATATDADGSAYPLDVLDRHAVRRAAAELGAVDVLVFTPAANVRKRLLDYADAEFDHVVGLNLRGSFDLVRAFGGPMAERGRGSIIGCSSIRAVTVEPGQGVYAATKAGLIQLLRAAAAELGPRGVRVNAIAPGVVETPLTAQIKADPAWHAAYAAKSALGRWAQPSDRLPSRPVSMVEITDERRTSAAWSLRPSRSITSASVASTQPNSTRTAGCSWCNRT
jgi:NAD(P)-dependent dehydrogenase (short-subunit alcohol dehydrogenase family)